MKKILIINGPNLNLLGSREPEVYGSDTLDSINQKLSDLVVNLSVDLTFFQSNAEHEIINQIHAAQGKQQFIIINPGAFTHTSIAIRDALLGVSIPFIEVHLSNIYRRESFRKHSYLSDVALGVISGLGQDGYRYALDYAIKMITKD
ncbi:MAG: type II 3-dehydroquinate dehydratase [Neisseriaceae bacterium]|nr:MAG: type II 3-dehydroquinate dehydratase [Neisseriaceae bacterium]